MERIAVIGGGIAGVTAAYALASRGRQVTLFEKQRYPAMDTSFANGGQLSASNAEVWNRWATVLQGLRWMLRKDAPLRVDPTPSFHKLSWFAEFIAAIPQYRQNTVETVRLALAAREHLYRWAEEEQIEFDLKREGILHIYRDRAGFEHAERVSELLARGGLERRPLSPGELKAAEPTLRGSYYGGFLTPSDASGDIHKFTRGLARACDRRGVRCLYGTDVEEATPAEGGVRVRFSGEEGVVEERFDGIVVSAGVGSRRIAAGLGDRVNVYPVKGYSITVELEDAPSRAAAPQVSLLDDETKIVASRLGDDRFRVAGTAEFSGYNRDIRADRIRPLVRWVETCFPEVKTHRVVPWAGLRPMMPNMMPRVGPGRAPGVFYNTGHGHLGWTLSAATAEGIADAVDAAAG